MAMLRAQDVRFDYTYENEAPQVVLQGVNLTVEKGSFVALLGHNGCGKSTLLSCLSGQQKRWSGSICWSGTELSALSADQLAQTLTLLPQGMPIHAMTS